MANIRFTETKLAASGKKGILRPDADGYYEVIVGGLNTFNSAGEYYVLEGAKALFEDSSILMRRIRSGSLFGETGHPQRATGQSMDEYISRILRIDEQKVCVHFKEIWLDPEYGRKNPQLGNSSLVAIMAKAKPAGPYGPALKEAFDNPSQNVCFSIRALTQDFRQNGRVERQLAQVVCWDFVTEPGISIANKWQSPGLESIAEIPVTRSQLSRIASRTSPIATEESMSMANDCLRSLDVNKVSVPTYTKW